MVINNNFMKTIIIIAGSCLSVFFFSFKNTGPSIWTVDVMHAKVGFSITHNMTCDVEASFRSINAVIATTGDNFSGSTIDFSADAATITTENDRRDKNIKSADFSDVENFPRLVVKSTSVTKKSHRCIKLQGFSLYMVLQNKSFWMHWHGILQQL